jgi:hypothetical protein
MKIKNIIQHSLRVVLFIPEDYEMKRNDEV